VSYEGYTIALCENRHRYTWDAMEDYAEPRVHLCPTCGAPPIWTTDVDETNGADETTGRCPGYVELEVDTPAVWHECPLCSFCHLTQVATYKIPKVENGDD